MKGYKAFNKDLTCKGFQYEIGKTYEMEEKPKACKSGFHFCKTIAECYEYYPKSDDTRICEVEAIGDIDTDDNKKFATNKIVILSEITEDNIRKGNSGSRNSGYRNSGYRNSGYRNSGDWNSGDRNSGDWNSGNWNSGDCNSGDCNSGDFNSGYRNSGYRNSGYRNSGDWNSGDRNSGDWNSGNWNSGNWNSGDCNSGDFNSGYRNSGLFNTEKEPKIKMFDMESDWTFEDWLNSNAREVMSGCPHIYSDFVSEEKMTEKEKESHPEHKTIGGFVKVFEATKEDKKKWWVNLSEDDRNTIKSLPNFDWDKFRECVGF